MELAGLRTGDLLGAITPKDGRSGGQRLVKRFQRQPLIFVEFAQFGSTVGSTLRLVGCVSPPLRGPSRRRFDEGDVAAAQNEFIVDSVVEVDVFTLRRDPGDRPAHTAASGTRGLNRHHWFARSSGSPTRARCFRPVARRTEDGLRTFSACWSASPRCCAIHASNSSWPSPTKRSFGSVGKAERSVATAGSWSAVDSSRSSHAFASPLPATPPTFSRPACPNCSTPPSSQGAATIDLAGSPNK